MNVDLPPTSMLGKYEETMQVVPRREAGTVYPLLYLRSERVERNRSVPGVRIRGVMQYKAFRALWQVPHELPSPAVQLWEQRVEKWPKRSKMAVRTALPR